MPMKELFFILIKIVIISTHCINSDIMLSVDNSDQQIGTSIIQGFGLDTKMICTKST